VTGYPVVNAIGFAILGVLVFLAACVVFARLAPFNVWKEIIQERNLAAGILAGAVALALGWIVAAAMH
jgi:uncharacterized membrane protein YjfL (UPF0719 family)